MGLLGYINLLKVQAQKLFVQFLNALNLTGGVPVGMSDSISGNDSTFVKSSCLIGDGVIFMNLDVQTTDTITATGSSGVPTCTVNGRLDFANGIKYYGVKIERASVEIAFLPMVETFNSDKDVSFDITSNKNHGVLGGASGSHNSTQDEFHYSQLGVGNEYYQIIESDNYYRIPIQVSALMGIEYNAAYFQDANDFLLGASGTNDFVGAAQEGSTNTTISGGIHAGVQIIIDDVLFSGNRGDLWSALTDGNAHKIELIGVVCNTAIFNLFFYNGSALNSTLIFKYINVDVGQNSVIDYTEKDISLWIISQLPPAFNNVPASESEVTKDSLNNVLTIINDNDFKETGTLMKQPDVQALKDADVDNVYFDIGGNQKEVTVAEIVAAIGNNPSVYGGDILNGGKSVKNISLK